MGNSKETKKRFLRVRGGARVRIRRTRVRASPERNASASTDRDTTAPSSRHCAEYEVSSPSLSSDGDDYEDHYPSSRHEPLEVQASGDVEEPGYQSDEDEPRWDYDEDGYRFWQDAQGWWYDDRHGYDGFWDDDSDSELGDEGRTGPSSFQ